APHHRDIGCRRTARGSTPRAVPPMALTGVIDYLPEVAKFTVAPTDTYCADLVLVVLPVVGSISSIASVTLWKLAATPIPHISLALKLMPTPALTPNLLELSSVSNDVPEYE